MLNFKHLIRKYILYQILIKFSQSSRKFWSLELAVSSKIFLWLCLHSKQTDLAQCKQLVNAHDRLHDSQYLSLINWVGLRSIISWLRAKFFGYPSTPFSSKLCTFWHVGQTIISIFSLSFFKLVNSTRQPVQ